MWIVCLADNSHEILRLIFFEKIKRNIQVAEWLALPIWEHCVPGLNPVGGRIQRMFVSWVGFIGQSLSLSSFYDLNNVKRDVKHQTIIEK